MGEYIKLSLYVTIQCIKNVQIFRKNYKIGGRNVSWNVRLEGSRKRSTEIQI